MTEKIAINGGNWLRFEFVGATLKVIILEYGNTKTNSPYIKFTLDEDVKGFHQTKEYQMNIPPWEQKALVKEYGALSDEGKVTGLFEAYRLTCTKIDEKNRPTVKLEKWQGHSEGYSNKKEQTQHESWDVHDTTKQITPFGELQNENKQNIEQYISKSDIMHDLNLLKNLRERIVYQSAIVSTGINTIEHELTFKLGELTKEEEL